MGLNGDNLDKDFCAAAYIVLQAQPTVSGLELAAVLRDVGWTQVTPIAAGMWMKRSESFRRLRRHQGNTWKPTKRFNTLCEELRVG